MKQFKTNRLLGPPSVEEVELERTANFLNTTMLLTALAGIIVVFLYAILPISENEDYAKLVGVTVTITILALKFLVLNRGYIRLASWLLVLLVLSALTVSLYFFGGIRDENMTWFFLFIAIGSLLLGPRAALGIGAIAILFTIFLFVLEVNGFISDQFSPVAAAYNLIPLLASLALTSVLLYTAVHQIRLSLHQVEQHQAALQESNLELQQENLERKRVETALREANSTIQKARNELEQQVQLRTAELTEANTYLEELLFAITHDLKEPLRSIDFFSDRLNSVSNEQADEKTKDYLVRILQASRRQRQLLDDIAILAELSKGVPLPKKATSLETAVSLALQQLDEMIAQTNAKIDVEIPLPFVYVKQKWAILAIHNLVENALKYTAQGNSPIIEITPYNGPRGTGIAVKDRGSGNPADISEKIFKLFQRGVGRDIEGTGAGLTITRQIAKIHTGHCWVIPRDGGGLIFYVSFHADRSA